MNKKKSKNQDSELLDFLIIRVKLMAFLFLVAIPIVYLSVNNMMEPFISIIVGVPFFVGFFWYYNKIQTKLEIKYKKYKK